MSFLSLSGGKSVIARHIANWATESLQSEAQKAGSDDTVGTSGFKDKYIDHQGAWAKVHIAGVAGATMIGSESIYGVGETGFQRVERQFREDRNQLNNGLAAKARGETSIKDGNRVYDVDSYIAEKHAELWDNGAGTRVGKILENAITGYRGARGEVFRLLCDY